ncbi:MAG: hypothetical protein WDM92_14775 [Caulobacteraceae bacterium]
MSDGTLGASPAFQRITGATCIGGMRYCLAAGRTGLAPIWVERSNGFSPQPASARALERARSAQRGDRWLI